MIEDQDHAHRVARRLLAGQFSSAEFEESLGAAVGLRVARVELDPNWREGGALVVTFADGARAVLYDDGQSCCEARYMTTDDDLESYGGAVFLGAEVVPAPDLPDEYGAHEVQFLRVVTSAGMIVVETHNEHNGYYGGFYVKAEMLEAEAAE